MWRKMADSCGSGWRIITRWRKWNDCWRRLRRLRDNLLPAKFLDLITFRNQDDTRHADEQAVFHNSWHVAQNPCQRRRIVDLAEVAIQDVMAFVGDKRFAVGRLATLNLRP